MFKKKSTRNILLLSTLVLITSAFVGNTIARYVTSTNSEDSARVAVWGINEGGTTMNLFDADYDLNGNLIAESNDGNNIIAPGTGKMSKFKILNHDQNIAPEVAYEVKIDVDDSKIDKLIKNNPSIQWKLDNNDWGTWEELLNSIKQLSGDTTEINTIYKTEKFYGILKEYESNNGKITSVEFYLTTNDGNILRDDGGYPKRLEIFYNTLVNEIDFDNWTTTQIVEYKSHYTKTGSTGIWVYQPGEFANAFKNGQEHTISWQWLMDNGTDELDTEIANITEEYSIVDEEGNEYRVTIPTVNLKINITAKQILGSVYNAKWQFNNNITGYADILEQWNYYEQIGYEPLPNNTIIKSNNLEFNLLGLSMQSAFDINVFTTISSTPAETISYIPENNLGIPKGWYEIGENAVRLIQSGNITMEDFSIIINELIPTSAPTITFPNQTTEALQDDAFVKWMTENATKIQ